jgi:hypothetical protein
MASTDGDLRALLADLESDQVERKEPEPSSAV